MALLVPDVPLRRRRKAFENFWLRALRGDNNDTTNSERLAIESSASNVSSWRRERSQRQLDECEVVVDKAPPPPPPIVVVKAPPPPPRARTDNQQQPNENEFPPPQQPPRSKLRRVTVATPPMSQRGDGTGKPRYVKRVQGPTLAFVLSRIQLNESDVNELDFSNLSNRNKRLEPYGGVLVARVLTMNRTVTRLVVRDHAIGDRGAVAIANMLRFNSTLEYIDLYSNGISDAGAEAIAKALYGHESLQHLALWSNTISNRGAKALAEMLKCNRSLKYLGLVHNHITADGAQALLDALEVNAYLETLNLATNRIPHGITTQIRMTLARNRVEAPRVQSTMKSAEAEVKKRLEELGRRALEDDDDAGSDTSGFLSCSETEDEDDEDDEDDGVWI